MPISTQSVQLFNKYQTIGIEYGFLVPVAILVPQKCDSRAVALNPGVAALGTLCHICPHSDMQSNKIYIINIMEYSGKCQQRSQILAVTNGTQKIEQQPLLGFFIFKVQEWCPMFHLAWQIQQNSSLQLGHVIWWHPCSFTQLVWQLGIIYITGSLLQPLDLQRVGPSALEDRGVAELPADLTVEGLALGASAFDNNPAVWLFAKLDFLLLLILGIVKGFHKLLPQLKYWNIHCFPLVTISPLQFSSINLGHSFFLISSAMCVQAHFRHVLMCMQLAKFLYSLTLVKQMVHLFYSPRADWPHKIRDSSSDPFIIQNNIISAVQTIPWWMKNVRNACATQQTLPVSENLPKLIADYNIEVGLIIPTCYFVISTFFLCFPNILHRRQKYKYPPFNDLIESSSVSCIGHRRGGWEGPENTLELFEKNDNRLHMFQLDVCLTKDKKLVVHHDSTLTRTCGVNKDVSQLNYEELHHFSPEFRSFGGPVLKSSRNKIPLLQEVFQKFPEKPMNIQLKYATEEGIAEFARLVKKYAREDITVWGAAGSLNQKLREANPDTVNFYSAGEVLKIYLLFLTGLLPFVCLRQGVLDIPLYSDGFYNMAMNFTQSKCLKCIIFVVFLILRCFNFFSRLFIPHLKKREVLTFYFILNEEEDYDNALSKGCSGIMTDLGENLEKYLKERQIFYAEGAPGKGKGVER